MSFPVALGIDDTVTGAQFHERNLWLVGLVNSAPYIGASLIGCWLSDPLNRYFARRGTIFIAAIFCILPVIGSAFAQNWYQLFICRVLLGLGMGAKVCHECKANDTSTIC